MSSFLILRVVINDYSFFLRNYIDIFDLKTGNLELPVLQNGNEYFKVIANDLKLSSQFISDSKNKYSFCFSLLIK